MTTIQNGEPLYLTQVVERTSKANSGQASGICYKEHYSQQWGRDNLLHARDTEFPILQLLGGCSLPFPCCRVYHVRGFWYMTQL